MDKFDDILPFNCLMCGAGTKLQPCCQNCQDKQRKLDEERKMRVESLKQRDQRVGYQHSMGIREDDLMAKAKALRL